MPKNTDNPTNNPIEISIANGLTRFLDVFNNTPNGQQQLHDTIYQIENQDLLPEQKKLAVALLNASLSLSFTLISKADAIDKFITYHE